MNTLQQLLAVAGALVVLAGVAGVLYAIARSSGQDARIKRLDEENVGYLRRLNYLEPRVEVLERENETLRALHNPADQISQLAEQEQTNHDQAMDAMAELTAAVRSLQGAS